MKSIQFDLTEEEYVALVERARCSGYGSVRGAHIAFVKDALAKWRPGAVGSLTPEALEGMLSPEMIGRVLARVAKAPVETRVEVSKAILAACPVIMAEIYGGKHPFTGETLTALRAESVDLDIGGLGNE